MDIQGCLEYASAVLFEFGFFLGRRLGSSIPFHHYVTGLFSPGVAIFVLRDLDDIPRPQIVIEIRERPDILLPSVLSGALPERTAVVGANTQDRNR